MALISPADVRAHSHGYTTDDDSAILRAIAVAEAQAARYLGWPPDASGVPSLEASARTFYIDAPIRRQPDTLQLPVWPVVSVSSVAKWTGTTYDAVSADQYALIPISGRVRLELTATESWLIGDRRTRVICVAGWTPETIEDAIADALARLASHVLTVGRGKRSESASRAGSTVTFRPIRMPSDVSELLAPYRLPTAIGMGVRAV
ncbi:MAG: hypothetical protein ACO3RX_00040 [Chthoniobacterales bacterium]